MKLIYCLFVYFFLVAISSLSVIPLLKELTGIVIVNILIMLVYFLVVFTLPLIAWGVSPRRSDQ